MSPDLQRNLSAFTFLWPAWQLLLALLFRVFASHGVLGLIEVPPPIYVFSQVSHFRPTTVSTPYLNALFLSLLLVQAAHFPEPALWLCVLAPSQPRATPALLHVSVPSTNDLVRGRFHALVLHVGVLSPWRCAHFRAPNVLVQLGGVLTLPFARAVFLCGLWLVVFFSVRRVFAVA